MRILVLNATPMTEKVLRFVLREAGHDVVLTRMRQDAQALVTDGEIDAVLLDIDLPDQDGFELCTSLRSAGFNGPILFVSHRREIRDKLSAFAAGADDFIVEPFDPLELTARVDAIARRYRGRDQQPTGTILKVGDAELLIADISFRRDGEPSILLTPTEMRLLECLMRNEGIAISRDALIKRAWGFDMFGNQNRVDVYIRRLRMKIEPDPGNPQYLLTVRGIGYMFQAQQPATVTLIHVEPAGHPSMRLQEPVEIFSGVREATG